MLYITGTLTKDIEWHIGDSMPLITGRVVNFQADGDELLIIAGAIRKASKISDLDKAQTVANWGYSYGDLIGICQNRNLNSIGEAIDYAYSLGDVNGHQRADNPPSRVKFDTKGESHL